MLPPVIEPKNAVIPLTTEVKRLVVVADVNTGVSVSV
jgi:hypothetical protein